MSNLLKKMGAFSVGPIVGALLGFITVPLITYFISPDEYGRTSMFTLAQGILSMLMYLGLDQAFVREFNEYKDSIKKLMVNALIIPLLMVFVLDIIVVFNARYISFLMFDTREELYAVYFLAIMLPFMIIENFSLLKIRMEEKGLQYSFFSILLKVFLLALTVGFFLVYEKSFRSVVYAMALAEIINGLILFFVALFPLKLSIRDIDKALIKKMLSFGLPLVPAALLSWVLTSMDKIMLRTLCDYTELGLYTAAFKIVSILGIIQTCFTLFWTPVAYRWYESKVDNKQFEMVNNVVAFIMTATCMGLLLFKDIVAMVLGADFRTAIYIFPFILLYPIMYTMSEATAVGIAFSRKTQYTIVVSTSSGLLNILLNYLLIPRFGGVGAAVATGASYIVFFWVRTLISRRLWFKFELKHFLFYTLIIVVNCFVHTFITGWMPYVLSIISILVIVIMNTRNVKDVMAILKDRG